MSRIPKGNTGTVIRSEMATKLMATDDKDRSDDYKPLTIATERWYCPGNIPKKTLSRDVIVCTTMSTRDHDRNHELGKDIPVDGNLTLVENHGKDAPTRDSNHSVQATPKEVVKKE